MTIRRIASGMALLGALLGAGAFEARADHCGAVLIFSGVTLEGQAGPKTNPGAAGCLPGVSEDESADTNYFVPGANSMSVGVTADPAEGLNEDGTRKSGAVQTGSVVITYADPAGGPDVELTQGLSLTWSGTRWNSQSFAVPGVLVRATATVLTQPGVTVSVTYRSVGEDA